MEISHIYIGCGQIARSWWDAPCLLSCSTPHVTRSFSRYPQRTQGGLLPFCQYGSSFSALPSCMSVNSSLQLFFFSVLPSHSLILPDLVTEMRGLLSNAFPSSPSHKDFSLSPELQSGLSSFLLPAPHFVNIFCKNVTSFPAQVSSHFPG